MKLRYILKHVLVLPLIAMSLASCSEDISPAGPVVDDRTPGSGTLLVYRTWYGDYYYSDTLIAGGNDAYELSSRRYSWGDRDNVRLLIGRSDTDGITFDSKGDLLIGTFYYDSTIWKRYPISTKESYTVGTDQYDTRTMRYLGEEQVVIGNASFSTIHLEERAIDEFTDRGYSYHYWYAPSIGYFVKKEKFQVELGYELLDSREELVMSSTR
jgi:hypothetical protein